MAHKEEEEEADDVSQKLLLPPYQRYEQLLSTLPTSSTSLGASDGPLRRYQGFWYPDLFIRGAIAFQNHFNPRSDDVFVASFPKSGTTWLRALTFATIVRKHHHPADDANHPILSMHPSKRVPLTDAIFGSGHEAELDAIASPRLLAMHMPYSLLPESVTSSSCQIVYVCRDPKDVLVSFWYFSREHRPSTEARPFAFDKAFDEFCQGASPWGPIWDHQLEYWRESQRRPQKVLFLKYEDLKKDITGNLMRLADFLGCPFSQEEERGGTVEDIAKLCSFEKMRDAFRDGERMANGRVLKNSSYFRKGTTGDWKAHLTAEMARRLDEITEEKLRGSGLSSSSA